MSATKRGPDGETVGVDGPEPTLDTIRAAIRGAMGELAGNDYGALDGLGPLGRSDAAPPAVRMAALARAYRDLGGDLELPLTPLAPAAGRVETGLVDKVAGHAVAFVADLPGLENALSHADVLHGELEAITAAPTPPRPPVTEAPDPYAGTWPHDEPQPDKDV